MFVDGETTDNGEEIVASFTGGVCDFGTDKAKHLSCLGLSFEDGEVEVSICTDGNDSPAASAAFVSIDHASVSKRLCAGRFSYLTARLEARGDSRPTVHSLYIKAR